MKNCTEIITVLDRSGSMVTIRRDMEGAFDTFIEDQKKEKTDEVICSLHTFDTVYETEYEGKPIAKVPPLHIHPRGGTALYDAVGKTINAVGERLAALKEEDRPARVVIVIITDGEENSSREFSASAVKQMVEHQTEKYSWQFIYLGANQNAFATGATLGVQHSHTMTYAANDLGTTRAFHSLGENLKGYRVSSSTADLGFKAKDHKDQEEALKKN